MRHIESLPYLLAVWLRPAPTFSHLRGETKEWRQIIIDAVSDWPEAGRWRERVEADGGSLVVTSFEHRSGVIEEEARQRGAKLHLPLPSFS